MVFMNMGGPSTTDEVHDFLLHAHWIEVYSRTAEFLERYLKR